MANYESMGRSNYFPVVAERLALIEKLFGNMIEVVRKLDSNLAAVLSPYDDNPEVEIKEDWQQDILFDLQIVDADNIDYLNLLDVLPMALPQDQSLVWISIGNEKLRYLVGEAIRINSEGGLVQHISLNQIYRDGEARAEY